MGHEHFRSLFQGIDESDGSDPYAMDIKQFLEESRRKSMAILLGGASDGRIFRLSAGSDMTTSPIGRHALCSLAHFGWIWKALFDAGLPRSRLPKLHITLVDIHPAAVARLMVVFALLQKSIQPGLSETDRLELEAIIFFTWGSYLIPDFCTSQ